MIYFAGIIEGRLENILTCLTHHITNAVSEGLNAKIQWIKYSSRGFGIAIGLSSPSSSILAVSISSLAYDVFPLNPLQSRKSQKS
jgi:hypothetical protein